MQHGGRGGIGGASGGHRAQTCRSPRPHAPAHFGTHHTLGVRFRGPGPRAWRGGVTTLGCLEPSPPWGCCLVSKTHAKPSNTLTHRRRRHDVSALPRAPRWCRGGASPWFGWGHRGASGGIGGHRAQTCRSPRPRAPAHFGTNHPLGVRFRGPGRRAWRGGVIRQKGHRAGRAKCFIILEAAQSSVRPRKQGPARENATALPKADDFCLI